MEIEETGWRNLNWRVSGTLYIMKNARKIDWLNIYHFGRISILWMMLYKILNKFGKIYLKLDIDQKAIEQLKKSRLLQQVFKWNTKLSDIVSAESALIVGQLDNFTNKHIELVHNGFSLKNETGRVLKKENLFLTVGRLGTKQKATDVLLKAFVESADFQDWDLKLIGPVEPDFRNCIKELVEKYPKVFARIEFTGPILEREKLSKIYQKAKVFILPSRWEAASLVLPEAVSRGCKLILSKGVSTYKDFLIDDRYGDAVEIDDVQGLAKAMVTIASNYDDINDYYEIRDKFCTEYSWKNIADQLYILMKKYSYEQKRQ